MLAKTDYTLLYVEDDTFISNMVMEYLSDFFKTIYLASNGQEALKLYDEKKPDIIITDIRMPKLSGLELASIIRKKDTTTPILITTAYTDTKYLLDAIELNLIKYLIKPIDEDELKEALSLCFTKLSNKDSMLIKLSYNYSFDMFSNILTHNKELVSLTYSQSTFLHLLLSKKGQTLTYEEIEQYVWKGKLMSDSALRSLVHDLRKIIDKKIIKNISKTGYKIILDV